MVLWPDRLDYLHRATDRCARCTRRGLVGGALSRSLLGMCASDPGCVLDTSECLVPLAELHYSDSCRHEQGVLAAYISDVR